MSSPRLRDYIALSIAAALVTLGLKSAAYLLTGSVGLLSDALESSINLLAALTAYICLWYAARPVDATHTYGHEKIEYFSSGIEGVLILVAGIGIIVAAIPRFYLRVPLDDIGIGTALALVATSVNLLVGRLLIRAGRQHHSIVLEADGQHLMSDVWTSIVVVVGLGLIWLTGWEILDPVIAIAMAMNIGWTGMSLIARSFNGLMDHAISAEEQATFMSKAKPSMPRAC